MYKSIYPYNNKDPAFLAFGIGDVFNLIEQIDGYWWSVHDENGNHGLVPATYLEVNTVSEEDVLRSLDKSIESINKPNVKGKGALNEEERRILHKLITHRQMVAAGNSLWSKGINTASSPTNGIPQQPKRQAPKAPPGNLKKGKSLKRNSAPPPPSPSVQGVELPRTRSLDFRPSQNPIDEGASSRIYNIVVNNGKTQLPATSPTSNQDTTNITRSSSMCNQSSQNTSKSSSGRKKSPSADSFRVFVETTTSSSCSDKDSIGSASPRSPQFESTGNTIGINELRGKNLTISRTNPDTNNIVGGLTATNFMISKSKETEDLKGKQKNSTDGVKGKQKSKSINTKTEKAPAGPVQKTITKTVVKNGPVKRNVKNENQYGSESSLCTSSLNSFSTCSVETSSTPNLSMSAAQSNSTSGKDMNVSEVLGHDLIDVVRSRCKLSFNKSLAAVRVVLRTLGEEVPDIKVVTDKIRDQIVDDKLSVHRGSLAHEDAARLQNILQRLTEHKQDSQQRSWAVHEDYEVIKDLLDDLVQTMSQIDPSISRTVLREDEYRYINDLIIYYQMEHRSKLRMTLIHAFGCFCELGVDFITQLLCSVLPTELALDLMQDKKDIRKFLTTCLLLTMVFSTGESVPYNHYVQFNDAFVNFVLDTIEDPPDADVEDQVSDALVGVLLGFNQHFKSPKTNVVLQCIAKRRTFRTLSEKVLILVNREKDPVAIFNFVRPCPDSVTKFLIDLFSSKNTSGIFFTNDLKVLIDIILRQITDRPVKDKARTECLSLFHSMLNTTNYSEHRHHAADFKLCFEDILMNREQESEVDLYIVTEITRRFSDLF